MIAECGRQITTCTIVYVVAGETQSLLGPADAEALGIMQITPEGQFSVRQLTEMNKAWAEAEAIISGNQTQDEINNKMETIMNKYKTFFQGLGRAKVEPIHIETDRLVKAILQKQ